MSLRWNFRALFESRISCKNKKIEIIMQKQHAAKINLAIWRLPRYSIKTVDMLKRKPKAANPMVNFNKFVLLFKTCN